MFNSVIDLEDLHLPSGIVRIGLVPSQSFERLVCGRSIAGAGIQKTQHLIERPIFQHELNDVLYRGQLVCHGMASYPPRIYQ